MIEDGRSGRFWPGARLAGWTYFIQVDREDGPIKVGKANNLGERFRALQGGNHLPLRFLGALPFDEVPERALHRLFREWLIRGEWFDCHPSLLRLADLGNRWFPDQYRAPQGRYGCPVRALSTALQHAAGPRDIAHVLYVDMPNYRASGR